MTIAWGGRESEITAQTKILGIAISNSMMVREITGGGEMFAVMVRQAQLPRRKKHKPFLHKYIH